MTISDLIKRLQTMVSGTGMLTRVKPDTQIKIGRKIGCKHDVFEYFDIEIDGKDIVLVPTDKWDRKSN